MTPKKIIDFDEELNAVQTSISSISGTIDKVSADSYKQGDLLKDLENKLSKIDPSFKTESNNYLDNSVNVYSNDYFLKQSEEIENKVEKEIHSSFHLLPPLTRLDYIVATIIGTIATLVDLLLVKIPKDVTYLDKYTQKGGNLTTWLRSLGVDEEGKLNSLLSAIEKNSKVSFDASTKHGVGDYDREISGFSPKTHRLMSLGHDPFFGLLFGVLDIVNGRISLIDSKGAIHLIPIDKYQNTSASDMLFAPFL